MRASASTRSIKFALGLAMFVAGAALMVLRPGVALAHHVTIYDQIDCTAWETGAEYIGGPADRKVVVDVMVNAEHISETFYFDNVPGHLGHVDSYVLYERSGSGTLVTSGSVKMYSKTGGAYTVLADTDYSDINLQCSGPTPTPTNPTTSTATATSTPPATETSVPPTSTPPATGTAAPPTGTPDATETAVATSTNTPESETPTATVTTTTQGTITPLPTNTPETPRTATPEPEGTTSGDETPTGGEPESTPTLTDEVLGSTPPAAPAAPGGGSSSGGSTSGGETGTTLPSAGDGSRTASGLLIGLLGLMMAGTGLTVVAAGLRERR